MTDAVPTGSGFIPAKKIDEPTEAATHAQATPPSPVTASAPASSGPTVGRAVPIAEPLPAQVTDQLARIEDKASRIEDKYARSESLLSRVEDKVEGATARMNEVARQSDVAALRNEVRVIADRTRRLPGAGALVLTAIITAVLTVVLTIAVQRLNFQTLLPPPR